LLAGLNAVRVARGQPPIVLPPTTMMGALFHYVTHAEPRTFQPMKANFGLMPELEAPVRDKRLRHQSYAARALAALDATVRQVDSYSSSDKDLGVAHTGVEVSAGRTRQ
jgi:methylenetetrahydrofolate--tRNA-(uracil-5-)-methyltransferase